MLKAYLFKIGKILIVPKNKWGVNKIISKQIKKKLKSNLNPHLKQPKYMILKKKPSTIQTEIKQKTQIVALVVACTNGNLGILE